MNVFDSIIEGYDRMLRLYARPRITTSKDWEALGRQLFVAKKILSNEMSYLRRLTETISGESPVIKQKAILAGMLRVLEFMKSIPNKESEISTWVQNNSNTEGKISKESYQGFIRNIELNKRNLQALKLFYVETSKHFNDAIKG